MRELRRLATADALLRTVADEALSDLQQKLPLELREGSTALDLESTAALRKLLADVESTLLAQLTGDGGE